MISANESKQHLLTLSLGRTGRGGTYLWVIVDELSAAKHKAFSRPQGESVLHILHEVGEISSNNL